MTNHEICHVCLVQGIKMYNCNKYSLKQFYEEIMAEKMSDELPQYFCYECAAMLFKFCKFKQKCRIGMNMLKDVLKYGTVDRHKSKLESSINILKVSKRVKNFSYKHKNVLEKSSQLKIEGNARNKKMADDSQNDNDKNIHIGEEINDKATLKETIIDETKEISDNNMIDDFMDEEKIETESIIAENNMQIENQITNADKSDSESENLPLSVHKKAKTNKYKTKEVCNKKKKVLIKNYKETGIKKKKSKFEYPKQVYLNLEHWKRSVLTEEEAMAEFEAKGKDPKYLAFPFKCEFCYKGFSKLEIKERHMRLAHCESRGSLVCRFCKTRYRIKCHLSKHLQMHFERYKCLRCDFVCNVQNWAHNHNRLHNGIMQKCTHCGLQFAHPSTYYTHLRIYHRSEHVCRVCGESFVSQKGLNKHTKIKHFTVDNNISKEESKNCYCETCDIRFETLRAYEEHFKQSAKHAQDNLKDKRTISELEKLAGVSLKRLGETRKTCFMCALSFRCYADFVKHHLSAHSEVPMDMPVIQQIHTSHIKPKTSLPNVVCEICGVTLKAQSIIYHMNAKHTRKQLFPCTTCGREFASKMILKRHILVHTGEKPHKCTLCEKRFTQKGSMQLHYRTFHLKEPYPQRNRRKWKETE